MNSVEYPERRQPKFGEKIVTGLIVGRDKKVVPQPEVEHLASLGCSDRDIAEYFGVSESTLRYNFSSELIKGRHQLKTSLRQAQLRVALDGNPTMLIWLGRNILGQNETPVDTDLHRALPWTDEFDVGSGTDADADAESIEEQLADNPEV